MLVVVQIRDVDGEYLAPSGPPRVFDQSPALLVLLDSRKTALDSQRRMLSPLPQGILLCSPSAAPVSGQAACNGAGGQDRQGS